jgi:hypothetical protein
MDNSDRASAVDEFDITKDFNATIIFASGIEIARLELTDEVLRYSVCDTIESLNGEPLEHACITFYRHVTGKLYESDGSNKPRKIG